MANSKINTEETILRTPTDAPANADANSVRVYTDGTNVYSKDASGTVVNLSTGGGGGASSAAPAGSIQLSDGSGGFNGSTWTIDGNGDLQPATHVDKQLGIVGKAVEKAYFGSGGINLIKDNAQTSPNDTHYAKIYTDNSAGSLYFKSVAVSNVHHYYMQDNDSSIELHLAANSKYFTLKTPAGMNHNQTLTLPGTIGSNGQVLALSNKTGTGNNYTGDLVWTDSSKYLSVALDPSVKGTYSTYTNFSTMIINEPMLLPMVKPALLNNSETWTSGGNAVSGVQLNTVISIPKETTSITIGSDFTLTFQESGTFTTGMTTSTTYDVAFSVHAGKHDNTQYEILNSNDTYSTTVTGSTSLKTITIPKADIVANLVGTDISNSDWSYLTVGVQVFNGNTSIVTGATGQLKLDNFMLHFDLS